MSLYSYGTDQSDHADAVWNLQMTISNREGTIVVEIMKEVTLTLQVLDETEVVAEEDQQEGIGITTTARMDPGHRITLPEFQTRLDSSKIFGH